MKLDKYLNEGSMMNNPDRKTMDLIYEVSDHIDFRGDKAADFIYLLLENINFHSEAKEVYNLLRSRK